MKIELNFKWIFLIYLILVIGAILTPLFFQYLFYRNPLFISTIMVFLFVTYSIYFFGGLVVFKLINFVTKRNSRLIFLKLMFIFGVILFISLLAVYGILTFNELSAKKEFEIAQDRAYQLVDQIEDYRNVYGYYPQNISELFEGQNYTFKTWKFDNTTNYQWSDGSYTYNYFRLDDNSISFDFNLGWWSYFVYDENTKEFFPTD